MDKDFNNNEYKQPEIDEEEIRKQTYNVNGTNSRNRGLFSRPGKYKDTLKENDKEKANYMPPTITIPVLVGTGIGFIISLATGIILCIIICIFLSFFVGLIINAIAKRKNKS